jgi:hypothetical protein
MSDSAFDPDAFLNSSTAEASLRRPPLPAGDYLGVLGAPKFRQTQGKKDPTLTYTWLDIPVKIDIGSNPSAVNFASEHGITETTLTYSGRVDQSESGGIDYGKGKSPGLRQAREATGLNIAGQSFSPLMLEGRQVRVKVKHETWEGELMDRVDAIAKP